MRRICRSTFTPMTIEGAADEADLRRDEFEGMSRRLHAEFDDALGSVAIDDAISAVVEEFGDAKVLSFVPVLAEHEARLNLRREQSTRWDSGAECLQGVPLN